MERKKRSKGSVWEFCYANKIFGTFGFDNESVWAEIGQILRAHTHTHTTAAKLVVKIAYFTITLLHLINVLGVRSFANASRARQFNP